MESLAADIVSGRFSSGDKLPSESALVRKFATSRITIGRALKELQHRGLIDRIAGSGTYVRNKERDRSQALLFGLMIPDLGETEIFDLICQGIANAPQASDHALLWGHADLTRPSKEEQAWSLCRQFITRKVAGVFFAPLEFEAQAEKANRRILTALKEAQIPVILLDRPITGKPERSRPDLVGINNRQAGYLATEHLIRLGCKRIGFLGYHGAASTISARMAGYEEALQAYDLPVLSDNRASLESSIEKGSLEGFVCVNDRMAGQLMHSFLLRGVRIPEEIRIVGIDDVPYASLLPVPLTTVRQPCREIGETALIAMLNRIDRPKMPARDILLDGELIVRKSCGSGETAK